MIEIENVEKSFGSLKVLDGVSLTVNKGEVVSIIGGSGSGKSTLLMCINGLEPIQGGHIRVDGTDVHARGTDLNKLRQRIGIVFQQWNAFPHLTVLENVTLAPRKVLKKSTRGGRRDRHRSSSMSGWATSSSLPRQALGRPAAAHGHRPRARHGTRVHAVRRGDIGARSATGRRSARHHAAARQGGHDDDPRHPRDGLRPRSLRPRRLLQVGQDPRDRQPRAALRQPAILPDTRRLPQLAVLLPLWER
jgi:ABC-type sugar transport system ATPase subunit